jgi:hypothetical protein
MATPEEPDFPPGHPGRFDYDPTSAEAIAWARKHMNPLGERDFPLGHPGAVDTPGNKNSIVHEAGVDPAHPELEPFTGRTPAQAEGAKALYRVMAEKAKVSVDPEPRVAPDPPKRPGTMAPPSGQPGLIDQMRDLVFGKQA